MRLELLPCAGEIIRGGVERSNGGAFGNRGGVSWVMPLAMVAVERPEMWWPAVCEMVVCVCWW